MSVDEYLSNPEYEHSEYVDGEVVALNIGTKTHSRVQVRCGCELMKYFDHHPGGHVAIGLHCRLNVGGDVRFRLPDVAVVLNDTDEDARYLDRAPDLVVEIRSPEDTLRVLFRKMSEYFTNGTRLAWLILPEEESVLVLAPDRADSFGIGETLDGGTVLPGLSVPVSDLFV